MWTRIQTAEGEKNSICRLIHWMFLIELGWWWENMNGCRLHEVWLSWKTFISMGNLEIILHTSPNNSDRYRSRNCFTILHKTFQILRYRWENHVDSIYPQTENILWFFWWICRIWNLLQIHVHHFSGSNVVEWLTCSHIDWRRQYKRFIYRLCYDLRSEQYCLYRKKEITLTIWAVTKNDQI